MKRARLVVRPRRRFAAALVAQLSAAAAGVLAAPALALACPVCFSAKDEASRIAFLATTVFLTALPLVLIGGVVMWLTRRVQAAEQAGDAEE